MTRLSYRLYRLVSGVRHWVRRRFTPAGWLALAALIMTGSIGVDMDQSVAFQGFALVACVLIVSMMAAPFFRGRFAIERVLPRYGSVGEPFRYHVAVRNLGRVPLRHLELIEDLADPRPTLAEYAAADREASRVKSLRIVRNPAAVAGTRHMKLPKPVLLPLLPARGEAEAVIEVTPFQRGALRFTGTTVARTDPLGLFRGFVRVPQTATVLVLPRRYPVPPLELPGAKQYQRGGVTLASAIGESDEFVSLRDYRPGDPLRHIHWRSWARTGRPIVKEFQDEYFVRHALILDTLADGASHAAFEEGVSVAASFACSLATQESLLDLMFIGPQAVCFTAGRGVGHTGQALEILAAVKPCREKSFQSLEELVLRHAPSVCGCICVLLAWDEPRRQLVRRLKMLGQPLLVLVIVEAGTAEALRAAPDQADRPPGAFIVLETGQVAEGLQQLESLRA